MAVAPGLAEVEVVTRARLEAESQVDAAVMRSIVAEADANSASAHGKAAALTGEMLRQSEATASASARAGQSSVVLATAKAETDAIEGIVGTLSAELSRLNEAARVLTLEHARIVEQHAFTQAALRDREAAAKQADARAADAQAAAAAAHSSAAEGGLLSQACDGEDAAAAEEALAAAAVLTASEASLGDQVASLRTAEAELAASRQQQATLVSQISAIAESTGAKKAATTYLQRELHASLAADEAARLHHTEAQRAVAAAGDIAAREDALLAEAEVTLRELAEAVRKQQGEVAARRDRAVRGRLEVERTRLEEQASSEASLAAQRGVHAAEDRLTQASVDFEGLLGLERQAQDTLAPVADRAGAIAKAHHGAVLSVDARKEAALEAEAALTLARSAANAASARAAAQRAAAAEAASAAALADEAAARVAAEAAAAHAEAAEMAAATESLGAAETASMADLAKVRQSIAGVSRSFAEAEGLLAATHAKERSVAEEHLGRCRDLEARENMLAQTAGSAGSARTDADVLAAAAAETAAAAATLPILAALPPRQPSLATARLVAPAAALSAASAYLLSPAAALSATAEAAAAAVAAGSPARAATLSIRAASASARSLPLTSPSRM